MKSQLRTLSFTLTFAIGYLIVDQSVNCSLVIQAGFGMITTSALFFSFCCRDKDAKYILAKTLVSYFLNENKYSPTFGIKQANYLPNDKQCLLRNCSPHLLLHRLGGRRYAEAKKTRRNQEDHTGKENQGEFAQRYGKINQVTSSHLLTSLPCSYSTESGIQSISIAKSSGLGLTISGGSNRPDGPMVYIQELMPDGDCYKVSQWRNPQRLCNGDFSQKLQLF